MGKKELTKGFICQCGIEIEYPAYVFAHWDEELSIPANAVQSTPSSKAWQSDREDVGTTVASPGTVEGSLLMAGAGVRRNHYEDMNDGWEEAKRKKWYS